MYPYLILISFTTGLIIYNWKNITTICRNGPINTAKQLITHALSNRIIETHGHYYIINYPYGISWYKLLIHKHRGPSMIQAITNEHGVDISDYVRKFMGPSHNFHSMYITPKMMGLHTITFKYTDSSTRTFTHDEAITTTF